MDGYKDVENSKRKTWSWWLGKIHSQREIQCGNKCSEQVVTPTWVAMTIFSPGGYAVFYSVVDFTNNLVCNIFNIIIGLLEIRIKEQRKASANHNYLLSIKESGIQREFFIP